MHSPYATTIRDLGTALRMSTMVTPSKPLLIELIDAAIKECRAQRPLAGWPDQFDALCEALDKLHEARRLAAGEQS